MKATPNEQIDYDIPHASTIFGPSDRVRGWGLFSDLFSAREFRCSANNPTTAACEIEMKNEK